MYLNSFYYNIIMERFGSSARQGSGPGTHAGSSAGANEELNPERSYGTDLRYLEGDEKNTAERADTSNTTQQDRVRRFMASAKAAGRYQQEASIAEPGIRGKTPRVQASIKGVSLPYTGDKIGVSGTTSYARKPKSMGGKFVGF